ncbi:hypothetical protein BDV12DRAFT_193317 [Aspergillus spectabilis]
MSEDIMKKIASQEFELRNVHCEDDSWIHHFNWHGQPVYTHSATPPDISLWVILSDPPNLNSVALRPIRKQTLIRNAMCYVDPVVVHYNHGVPEDYAGDIPRCTAGLLRFAKGRTFKFYSPHGCWVNDAREREARTKRDEGDADFYYAPNTRVRNGFIDCHIIKPCQMWELRRRVIEKDHYGMGRHSDDLPADEFKKQLKFLWAAIPMYNASLAFTKISLLFQYLRIFPNYHRFCTTCHIVLALVTIYLLWAIAGGFINCIPVAKFWDRELPGSCFNFKAVWFFNSSFNIATDLMLLVLPMPLISKLMLPMRQKVALLAVFALGGFVVITSILRLFSLHAVAKSNDTSWSNVSAAYWTAAECNVAIICACLPFLRPLITRILPEIFSANSKNQDSGNQTRTIGSRTMGPRVPVDIYAGDPEFGLVTIDTDARGGLGGRNQKHTSGGGIEVMTDFVQDVRMRGAEESSQRRLIVDG